MSKVRGGIGTMSDHLLALFERHGGELRRHTKVARIVVDGGAVRGVELGDGEVVTAPVVVSNLDPTTTFTQLLDRDALPDAFARRVDAIDHRAAYFQMHFALRGLPEYRGPYEVLNEVVDAAQRHLLRHGGADAARLRGLRPRPGARVALVQPADPVARRPALAPEGMHAASSFAFYLPIGADRETQGRLRDEMAERIVAKIAAGGAELPRPDRAPAQLPGLHLRADVRLHRRRLHPRAPAARVHGPVPARAARLARQPGADRRASTSAAPGATVVPGSPSSPGYNAGYDVLDAVGADAAGVSGA